MKVTFSRLAPVVLLALFAALAFVSLSRESVTFDETAHIPAGLTYLQKHDLRMNAEHPPLVKAWATLPVYLFGTERPPYEGAAWRAGNQWVFGYELLNGPLGATDRYDPDRLVTPARCMMVLLGVLLGLVILAWARDLHGQAGGLLALAVFSLSPTMLAHARLVTTDLPAALGYALTLWLGWRYTRRPSYRAAAMVGCGFGFALLTKYSTVLLGPALIVLWLFWLLSEDRTISRKSRSWMRRRLFHVGLIVFLAWVVLWAGYGFRFVASNDVGYSLPWDAILAQGVTGQPVLEFLREHRLAPEGYLYGMAYALGGAANRLAYFNGELSVSGRPAFFPVAFLLKTAPAVLGMFVWALVAGVRRNTWRGLLRSRVLFLVIPAAIYLAVAILGNLNIGHRHLVPMYPLLFVAIGSLASAGLWKPGKKRVATTRAKILAGLLVLTAVSTVVATPGYLSWFNLFAGWNQGGARYFVDSSLDWGQDLPGLKRWMDREQIGKVHLAYFGTADPRAYGIRYTKVVMVHDFHTRESSMRPEAGDWFVISRTLLQGAYLEPDRELAMAGLTSGTMQREWITAWDSHSKVLRENAQVTPGLGDWLVQEGKLTRAQRDFLSAPLLTTWIDSLRTRPPDARIGGSLIAFKIQQ